MYYAKYNVYNKKMFDVPPHRTVATRRIFCQWPSVPPTCWPPRVMMARWLCGTWSVGTSSLTWWLQNHVTMWIRPVCWHFCFVWWFCHWILLGFTVKLNYFSCFHYKMACFGHHHIPQPSFSWCMCSDAWFDHDACFPVDGDLSINKLVFMPTRAYKKDSGSLISSGPRAHIHIWNVFQGGTLMAQFAGVSGRFLFIL